MVCSDRIFWRWGAVAALGLVPFGAWPAPAPCEGREWVVLGGSGGARLIEAASIEETGPAVLITDTAGKKGGYNLSAVKERIPAAPEDLAGVTREACESAIRRLDAAAGKYPAIGAALGDARAGWEKCIAAMDAEAVRRREVGLRVDSYLADRPEGREGLPATEVERRVRLGEEIIASAPHRATEIQEHIGRWRALLAPPEEKVGEARRPEPIDPGALRLPGDFRLRVPAAAASAGSVTWVAGAAVLSVMFFLFCGMRGMERVVRLRPAALGYLGCAVGGLGLYGFVGVRLLEVPPDAVALKAGGGGDASLVETLVAFSRRRADLAGDPGDFASVSLHDGSVNLFLADRVEFVGGPALSPLVPRRLSVAVDVRDDAVLFYQEVSALGLPLVVTLAAPVEGSTGALRFGEPAARVGTWAVLPRSLVAALWESLRGAMAGALEDVGVGASFGVERISEGSVHMVLRPSGGGSTRDRAAYAKRGKAPEGRGSAEAH